MLPPALRLAALLSVLLCPALGASASASASPSPSSSLSPSRSSKAVFGRSPTPSFVPLVPPPITATAAIVTFFIIPVGLAMAGALAFVILAHRRAARAALLAPPGDGAAAPRKQQLLPAADRRGGGGGGGVGVRINPL